MEAWIGLGSNLGDREAMLRSSLAELEEHPRVLCRNISSLYRSPAWGNEQQRDYYNAVAQLDTSLGPAQLLKLLLETENRMGRVRSGERWEPRNIDLDLLTFEDLMIESAELQLPHPRMHLRSFVLVPLLELDPAFEIPGIGRADSQLALIDDVLPELLQPFKANIL